MGYLKEQVSYIHGLADGLGLNEESKEGKVIKAILTLLDDMADSIEDNEACIDELSESLESVSEDLEDLEEEVYESDEIDDDDIIVDYLDEEDGESDFVEVVCPKCGDTIYFDPQLVESRDDLYCPSCNDRIPTEGSEEE